MPKKRNLWGESDKRKDEFERHCSVLLSEVVQKARRKYRKISIKQWSAQFRDLYLKDKIEKERIKKVLYWYVGHFKEKYVPKAYSARSFRERFVDIELAMKRESRQGDLFEDFDVEIIKDTTKERIFTIDYNS